MGRVMNHTTSTSEGGISWLARALHLVCECPDLRDAEVADLVGVDVHLLVENRLYRRMAAYYRFEVTGEAGSLP
jgi:hypothetical protein